jgi:hypothetical protein
MGALGHDIIAPKALLFWLLTPPYSELSTSAFHKALVAIG